MQVAASTMSPYTAIPNAASGSMPKAYPPARAARYSAANRRTSDGATRQPDRPLSGVPRSLPTRSQRRTVATLTRNMAATSEAVNDSSSTAPA